MPKKQVPVPVDLFGNGLVVIDRPNLVRRYNACLRDMGLRETALPTFRIDRMGWSPEIAAELEDNYYLSHGDANPLAIILTPEQATSDIYFPMHSFDWRLMDVWFRLNRVQIVDITKDTAIWLDIDQEVDLYSVPADLLMVGEVIVRVHTPGELIARADMQQTLVLRWLKEDDAHLNVGLIEALKVSAKDGDLRRRHLIIRDLQYSDVLDFYSRKFGGSFVLRSQNKKPLIFVRDVAWVQNKTVFPADIRALPLLIEHGYVDTDIGWWQTHLDHLKVVAESFLIEVVDAAEPTLEYAEIKEIHRRRLVNDYADRLPIYLELVRLREAMKLGELPEEVSDEARVYLYHPSDELSASSREVIWQLLTYIQGGRFVPLMYRHQKTAFMEAYTHEWHMPHKSWARARVSEYQEKARLSAEKFDW